MSLFFGEWISLYNSAMKLFFIGSSVYVLYLMKFRYRCVFWSSVANTAFLHEVSLFLRSAFF